MIANVLVVLIALFHVWVLVLEMFLWQRPIGYKTFGRTPEEARDSATLAANQGRYNGFLAAGLVWSAVASEPMAHALKMFFLVCVLMAGVMGGLTASRRILYVQALPALLTLGYVLVNGRA